MSQPTPPTIYCPQVLRDLWCSPPDDPAHGQLSGQWYAQYPSLFDKQDLRMARTQSRYHFYEWFARDPSSHVGATDECLCRPVNLNEATFV
jgi:hypothetical protein